MLVKQELLEQQHWSLPGGTLEHGETISSCLVREMKEETGLDIKVKDLLYICDSFRRLKHHVVDMTFMVERVGGELSRSFFDKSGRTEEGIRDLVMVPIDDLQNYKFSPTFQRLVKTNFPGRGSYQGDFHIFYGFS